MIYFATGFRSVAQLLLILSGGLTAIILFLCAIALFACLAGTCFDLLTRGMARRWERKQGNQPRGKLGQIILAHYRKEQESPE